VWPGGVVVKSYRSQYQHLAVYLSGSDRGMYVSSTCLPLSAKSII